MEPWSHRDTDFTDVWAIVLAAGRSTRMEAFKQLLPFGGRTVVEAAVWSLVRAGVGVERVIVVVGHRAEEVARVVQPLGARIATNRKHDRGMLSSVQTGLASVPEGARAVLIALGDQPFGEPEVARAVVRSWRNSGRGLIVPSHDGRRGHPLLIDLKYRDAVAKLSPDVGCERFCWNILTTFNMWWWKLTASRATWTRAPITSARWRASKGNDRWKTFGDPCRRY